jgi:hypothetical protein
MEHDHYEHIPENMVEITTPSLMTLPKETRPIAKGSACTTPTSSTEFFEFYNHIKEHRGFDSEKLQEAKNAIVSGCFTAKQVKITLSGFLYEETKLEFAKFAFNYCFDKNNYSIVKNGLDNEEDRTNLEAYVHNW